MITPGNLSKRELAYWAGLFDGEGCIKIRKNNRSRKERQIRPEKRAWKAEVDICGSFYATMQEFHEKFGGCIICVNKNGERGNLPLYRVILQSIKAENFIKLVYPFLKIKKDQAKNFLAYRKTFKHPYSHGSIRLDKRIENKRLKMLELAKTLKRVGSKPVTTERRNNSNELKLQSELQEIETCREKSEAISPPNLN